MADDGLLLNFDLGTKPLQPLQPKFKGGKWRDRAQARRQTKARAQYEANRRAPTDTAKSGDTPANNVTAVANGDDDFAIEQPAKRIKRTVDSRGPNRPADRTKGGQPKQVVSSLFTFNPSAKTAAEAEDATAEPAVPSNAPLAPEVENFTSLGLSRQVAEHLLQKMEIKAPTSIQKAAIPRLVKEDVDAFLQAETGSGKTLAYLLPIVQRLASLSTGEGQKVHRDSGLFAIVLAPTRELSKQISVVLEMLLNKFHWLVSTTVTGGEKMKSEKARLRKGVNILVATPGRLSDHLQNTTALDVSKVRWLVLDEGDRLMELGFEKDLSIILDLLEQRKGESFAGLPDKRITVLCSATMRGDVLKLGEKSLRDAVHISNGKSEGTLAQTANQKKEETFTAPAQLQQSYAVVPAKLRLVALVALMRRTFARQKAVMKSIIFISCADSVDFHFRVFARKDGDETASNESMTDSSMTSARAHAFSSKGSNVQIFRLHGSLPQTLRTSTLAKYSACKEPAVLVCTDVASRGLDLPHVDFVVEYDPPFNKEDHLHRVGRTARAGKEGRAMIFLQPGPEEEYVEILKKFRSQEGRPPAGHDCEDILRKGFAVPGLGGDKGWDDRATEWQLDIERWTIGDPKNLELARQAYQSHVRAYATHVAAERHMFDMAELHLGHLAKAFALRDKPGSIRVPGLRPSSDKANKDKLDRKANAGKAAQNGGGGDKVVPHINVDIAEGKQKMRTKMREQAGLSEFNLG